jgi:xylulokinase
MGLHLGLDASTQSLSAVIVDTEAGRVVADQSVVFGRDLPAYRCPHGYLEHANPAVRHGDPVLWAEALDRICQRLIDSGFNLSELRGVSGAAQQHGSVYLSASVDGLAEGAPLADRVRPRLSRPTAPLWLDSSTRVECLEIAAALGGDARVREITGSIPIERFTAAQIRKFHKEQPERYHATTEIHLVSSFMASLLIGERAPVDLGDAAGMNLLDLSTGTWCPALLDATAPDLAAKLPRVVASPTPIGCVAPYFVSRYGFAEGTPVIAFTGDNPSSLVGMGATRPGDAVISLGTSDTYFAATAEPRTDPSGYGHVFGNPAGGFLSLICFANGSLAREAVARQHGLDWEAFQRAVESVPPGNDGNWMLPYFAPEMTPRTAEPCVELHGADAFRAGQSPTHAARAVVEAQALTMRAHSTWMGARPPHLRVTGGASRNPAILQVFADVFQAELQPLSLPNASALGAALRAAQAVEERPWADLYARFSVPDQARIARPRPAVRAVYDGLEARFRERWAAVSGAR